MSKNRSGQGRCDIILKHMPAHDVITRVRSAVKILHLIRRPVNAVSMLVLCMYSSITHTRISAHSFSGLIAN